MYDQIVFISSLGKIRDIWCPSSIFENSLGILSNFQVVVFRLRSSFLSEKELSIYKVEADLHKIFSKWLPIGGEVV